MSGFSASAAMSSGISISVEAGVTASAQSAVQMGMLYASTGFSENGGNSKTGYEFKPGVDEDFRGTGKTYQDAVEEAFKKTGIPKEDFKVTKWAKDAYGKSYPVEWRANNGAEVNIDIGHTTNGPDVPHVGYQTGGKRGSGGAVRGHILVDDVPVNR
jgi:hypothetical protein